MAIEETVRKVLREKVNNEIVYEPIYYCIKEDGMRVDIALFGYIFGLENGTKKYLVDSLVVSADESDKKTPDVGNLTEKVNGLKRILGIAEQGEPDLSFRVDYDPLAVSAAQITVTREFSSRYRYINAERYVLKEHQISYLRGHFCKNPRMKTAFDEEFPFFIGGSELGSLIRTLKSVLSNARTYS